MDLMEKLARQAQSDPKRVAFPESRNEMILQCAEQLVRHGYGSPLLIGNPSDIQAAASGFGVKTEGFGYFDNTDEAEIERIVAAYTARYDDFSEKAVRRKSKDPVNCAMFLAKLGEADCVAAGREYTTADVILAAQTIGGLQENCSAVSSLGILNIPGFEGPEGNMLAIADCAINMAPDAEELAAIAMASADTVASLLGWEPRVAMLAFSTCGSSEHESLDVIRDAVGIVRGRRPGLKIDGEFQFDSAIIPRVAEKKVGRESEVAGRANVLIFPNLHAGNIGVKIFQYIGHADAYGPVLQGFAYPVCDFSRGAPLSEMMGNIIMLIVRAQAKK
ncbi:MAG: phosphate acyltransferase [Clostridia bacterium]|nr:phosphate acyltransferase [Clostridia bacterium]